MINYIKRHPISITIGLIGIIVPILSLNDDRWISVAILMNPLMIFFYIYKSSTYAILLNGFILFFVSRMIGVLVENYKNRSHEKKDTALEPKLPHIDSRIVILILAPYFIFSALIYYTFILNPSHNLP